MDGLDSSLRSACTDSGWSYVALWKVNHAHGILSWDASFTVDAPAQASSAEALASSLSKMSFDIHRLGEGPLGRAALTGKHEWLFAPHPSRLALSNLPPSWPSHFAAGIKTVAVIPTAQGVLQLGSPRVIPESPKIVARFTLLLSSPEPFTKQQQQQQQQPPTRRRSLSDEASTIPPRPATLTPVSTISLASTISPASSTTPASTPSPALALHQGSGSAVPGLNEIKLDFFPSHGPRWVPAPGAPTASQPHAALPNAGSGAGASLAGSVAGVGRGGGSSQLRPWPASSSLLRNRLEGLQQARLRSRLEHQAQQTQQVQQLQQAQQSQQVSQAEQQAHQLPLQQEQVQLKQEPQEPHRQPVQEQHHAPNLPEHPQWEIQDLQSSEARGPSLKRARPEGAAPTPVRGSRCQAEGASEGCNTGASLPTGAVEVTAAEAAGKRLCQGVPSTLGISAPALPLRPRQILPLTAGAPRAPPAEALEGVLMHASGPEEGPGMAVQGGGLSLQSLAELLMVEEGETGGEPAGGVLERVSPRYTAGVYAGERGKCEASLPFESGLGDEYTLEVLLSEALGSPRGALGGPEGVLVSPKRGSFTQAHLAGERPPLPRGMGVLEEQPGHTGSLLGPGGTRGVPGAGMHLTEKGHTKRREERMQLQGMGRQWQRHAGVLPEGSINELSRARGQPGGMPVTDSAFDELSQALGAGLMGRRGLSADVAAQPGGPHLARAQASNSQAAGKASTGQSSHTGAGGAPQVSPSTAHTTSQKGGSPALSGSEGRSSRQVATVGEAGGPGGSQGEEALQGQEGQGAQDPLHAMEEMALQGALKLAAGLKLKRAQGGSGPPSAGRPGPCASGTPARGSLSGTPEEEEPSPSSYGAPRAHQDTSTSQGGFSKPAATHAQRLALGPEGACRDPLAGGFAGYVEALRGFEDPQVRAEAQRQGSMQSHGLQALHGLQGQGMRAMVGEQGFQRPESEAHVLREHNQVLLQRQWQQQRQQRLLLQQLQQRQQQQQQLQQQQHQHEQRLLIRQQRDKQLLLRQEQQWQRLLGFTPGCHSEEGSPQRRPLSALSLDPWAQGSGLRPHPEPQLQDWAGVPSLESEPSPLTTPCAPNSLPQAMQQRVSLEGQQAQEAFLAFVGAPYLHPELPQTLHRRGGPPQTHGMAHPHSANPSTVCYADSQASLAGPNRGMVALVSGLEGAGLPGLVGLERLGHPGVTAGAASSPQAGAGVAALGADAAFQAWPQDFGPEAAAGPGLEAVMRTAPGAANASGRRFTDGICWTRELLTAALHWRNTGAPGPSPRNHWQEGAVPGLGLAPHALQADAWGAVDASHSSTASGLNGGDSRAPVPAPSPAAVGSSPHGATASAVSWGVGPAYLSASNAQEGRSPLAHLLVAKPESVLPGTPSVSGQSGGHSPGQRRGAVTAPAGSGKKLVPLASPLPMGHMSSSLMAEQMRVALQGLGPSRPAVAQAPGSGVRGAPGGALSAAAMAVEAGMREGRPLVDRQVASTMAASLSASPALQGSQLDVPQVGRAASASGEGQGEPGGSPNELAMVQRGGPAHGLSRVALGGSGSLSEPGRSEGTGRKGPLAPGGSLPSPGRALTRRMEGRGRPRDRQLIQDRLQALRDLLPGTSKVSIEMLLERAMQRIGFLREATSLQKLLLEASTGKERQETPAAEVGPVMVSRLSSSVLAIKVRLKLTGGVAPPVDLTSLLSRLGLVVCKGRMVRRSQSPSDPQPQAVLATVLIEASEMVECAEIALRVRSQLDPLL